MVSLYQVKAVESDTLGNSYFNHSTLLSDLWAGSPVAVSAGQTTKLFGEFLISQSIVCKITFIILLSRGNYYFSQRVLLFLWFNIRDESTIMDSAPSWKVKLSPHLFTRYMMYSYDQWTYFFVSGATASPQWARASSFTRLLDHTQRRTTVGRIPL